MKMKNLLKISLSLLLTLSALLLTNCNDKEASIPPSSADIEIGKEISHSVAGLVKDENGNPVVGAKVTMLSYTSETNEDGVFELFDIKANEKHAYVKVEKSGYFLGSRSYIPLEGVNKVEIKLIPQKKVGEFPSSSGGEVSFDNVRVSMKAGFMTSTGAAYTGRVRVYAAYLDPENEEVALEMPGSLRASSEEGEAYLKTFGMIGVELKDENGKTLQLAEENSAELSMPIPASMRANAPASIPLWFFDEAKGYWVEEGSATQVDGKYIGTVEHFTFWNVDIKVPSLECFGRFLDELGLPLAGVKITLRSPESGLAYAYTSSTGVFGGIIPAGVELELCASGGFLGNTIYCTKVGPFQPGDSFGDITIPDLSLVRVHGNLLDCDDNATEGIVKVDDFLYVNTSNSNFEFRTTKNTTYRIRAVNLQGSYFSSKTIIVAASDVLVKDLRLCDTYQGVWRKMAIQGLGTYYIDGEKISIVDFGVLEDKSKGIVRFRVGESNGYTGGSVPSYLSIDIPSGYTGPGMYNLTETDGSSFNIYTGKPSNKTLVAYDIDLDIVGVDVNDSGDNQFKFTGTVTQFNTTTNKNETYAVTGGNIFWKLF